MATILDVFERMAMVKALLRGIEVALEVKCAAAGLGLMPELRPPRDPELLDKAPAKIKTADSPDDLRRVWTRKLKPRAAKSGGFKREGSWAGHPKGRRRRPDRRSPHRARSDRVRYASVGL